MRAHLPHLHHLVESAPRSLARLLLLAPVLAQGCLDPSSVGNTQSSGASYGFQVDTPTVVDNGGAKLTSPKIVTVTYGSDPSAAMFEAFTDKLVASSYWAQTLFEYGIGAATVVHVHATDAAPASIATDTLETYVDKQIATSSESGWPAYDAKTIYVLLLPASTKLDPTGCYHSETVVGANAHVPFVVIDQNDVGTRSPADALTENSVHEISEGITNPHVLSDTAVVGFDAAHLAWNIFMPDAEIGDVCEGNADADYAGPMDLPFPLQRMWSNVGAHEGHNPCVPIPTDPYYNVTPLSLETISVFVNTDTKASTGLGYRVPIGTTKTIHVGYYSDAPIKAPWTLTAVEGSYFSPASNKRVTITVGRGSGNTGDTDTLTITANPNAEGAGNAVLVTLTSAAAGLPPHTIPMLIGTY